MKRFAGSAKLVLGCWAALWPVYLCANWAILGSVTAVFATTVQLGLLVVLALATALGWRGIGLLARIGAGMLLVAGLAALLLFNVNRAGGVALGSARIAEVASWFVFLAGLFLLFFGLARGSKAPRLWLLFGWLWSAAIWAWTNFSGTKLLDGSSQRLFDLAILEALFTLSTLVIFVVWVVDLVLAKLAQRKAHDNTANRPALDQRNRAK